MSHPSNKRSRKPVRRRAMTLAELIAVSTILVLMAGAMGTLALGVQESNEFHQQRGITLQHGQVTVQRIQRALNSAHANASFPGFLILSETAGSQLYPDVLIVWSPSSAAVNPAGLPAMNELIVFCPNPNRPQELWEITAPSDTRTAPDPSNTSQWRTELAYLKTNSLAKRVVLTDLIRTATASSTPRSVIRFEMQLRPSEAEWNQFIAGTRSWDDMSWVQGIHNATSGLRQAWCRFELQLRPGDSEDHRPESAVPFFGSGAVMYELQKP